MCHPAICRGAHPLFAPTQRAACVALANTCQRAAAGRHLVPALGRLGTGQPKNLSLSLPAVPWSAVWRSNRDLAPACESPGWDRSCDGRTRLHYHRGRAEPRYDTAKKSSGLMRKASYQLVMRHYGRGSLFHYYPGLGRLGATIAARPSPRAPSTMAGARSPRRARRRMGQTMSSATRSMTRGKRPSLPAVPTM